MKPIPRRMKIAAAVSSITLGAAFVGYRTWSASEEAKPVAPAPRASGPSVGTLYGSPSPDGKPPTPAFLYSSKSGPVIDPTHPLVYPGHEVARPAPAEPERKPEQNGMSGK